VNERLTVLQMVGEFCREAAVLVTVFSPLERVVNGHQFTLGWFVITLGISGALLVAGIVTERRRK